MNNLQGTHPGESISPWIDSVERPIFSALSTHIEVDVCVVGGGIAGLTTAYLLTQEGKKVCVLEDFQIGSGQTGRTTAHFVTALDTRYFVLEKYHGHEGARLAAESHHAAINKVEEIVATEQIDCDLQRIDGYLFTDIEESQAMLDHELAAIHRAGLTNVTIMGRAPFDTYETGPTLCFPNQLTLNPIKYINGLAECIFEKGGEIFTHTHVVEIHGGINAFVKTAEGNVVKCQEIVVATNSPINDLVAIHTKQASYRTYVIGMLVPKGTIGKGLFWDTENPYHYISFIEHDEHYDILLVGGEDHKTGQNNKTEESYNRLEEWARKRFSRNGEVIYRWSGQVMETVDGLAYIGRNPMDYSNVYVITGHSGNGMTYATIGGMLITDQILGKENPWETVYDPSRISLRAATHFFRENANTIAQYKDWLMEKQFGDVEHINEGEGVVFRDGLKLIAAYKDEDGNTECYSAVCTHLGGIVRWNSAEKSWDCPCHGSRFDCHGKVLEGPAYKDLKPILLDTPIPRVEFLRLEINPRSFDF